MTRLNLKLALLITLTTFTCAVQANLDRLCGYTQGLDKKPIQQGTGFIKTYETEYFSTLLLIDGMLKEYVDRYRLNVEKRSVRIEKRVTKLERVAIIKAAKEVDNVIATFSGCSQGDCDYMEVKDKYLPLAKKMRHDLLVHVLQPLGIERYTPYDHVRKVATPVVTVAIAVALILLLDSLGYLPTWIAANKCTLYSVALAVAGAGIAFNYKKKLLPCGTGLAIFDTLPKNGIARGTDFGALVNNKAANEAKQLSDQQAKELKEVAEQVTKVAKTCETKTSV